MPSDLPDFDIRSITFQSDGSIAIEYIGLTDFKANGLQLQHVALVPAGEDYDDEIEAVHEAALELVRDVVDDLGRVAPFNFNPPEEDDGD